MSIFDSLWNFFLALAIAESPDAFGLSEHESTTLRHWVSQFIADVIGPAITPQGPDIALDSSIAEDYFFEKTRRWAHAMALRLGVYIAASPSHIEALRIRAESGDELVVEWLVRGLILADRLLIIAYHDRRPALEELRGDLERTYSALGFSVDAQSYPDILNPFIYGPDEYDHALSGALAIIDASLASGERSPRRVFWMTDQVESRLKVLVHKLETPGEVAMRESRSQAKPNRLGVILDRTPQELAQSILEKTGTSSV